MVNLFKGLPYERCAELSYIIHEFRPVFNKNLEYLDIGSGKSPLPSFLLKNTEWNITCLDKYEWVDAQYGFAARVKSGDIMQRLHIRKEDLLQASLPEETFDIITCISVIEHFEGDSDQRGMAAIGKYLKRGGICIITAPVNEENPKEYYLERSIYGAQYGGNPVFYQRHYDEKGIRERLIGPSGLIEKRRIYFGEYGYPFFEKILQIRPKILRVFCSWATHRFAKKFLSYSDVPIGKKSMPMNTAAGVILVMERP